jgi:hypothetical protein
MIDSIQSFLEGYDGVHVAPEEEQQYNKQEYHSNKQHKWEFNLHIVLRFSKALLVSNLMKALF